MNQPELVGLAPSHTKTMIEVQDAKKTYQTASGPLVAVEKINLKVEEGEFVCVVGPSGCGKSTLMMMLAGLIPPSAGRIGIGATDVLGPYTDVGIVFQSDLLMEWRSTLDNILVQAEFRKIKKGKLRPRAMELLEMVGLSDFADKYPRELSGGMRQRVSICRALVHDPALLLMDEPFGALDALTREQLNLDLQDIWQGTNKTVVFITHSIPEAVFLADRVLVFGNRPGKIAEQVRIDLPRPRLEDVRETEAFGAYAHRIREVFHSLGVIRKSRHTRA